MWDYHEALGMVGKGCEKIEKEESTCVLPRRSDEPIPHVASVISRQCCKETTASYSQR